MGSREVLGAYLKKLRLDKNISLRDVYNQIGVTYSRLSMIENGKRNVSPDLLRSLANVYGVNYMDLYAKAGYVDNNNVLNGNTNMIPIYNMNSDFIDKSNAIDYISLDFKPNDINNYCAFVISKDNMEPLFTPEDIAIVHLQENYNSGNTCIILVGNNMIIAKIVDTDIGIDLVSMNPFYPVRHFSKNDLNKKNIKVIGKVIEARKKKIFE